MVIYGYEIGYLEDVKCVKWSAKANASLPYFRESIFLVADIFRDIVKTEKSVKILVDMYQLKEILQKDIEWVNVDITKDLFLRNGIRHIAIVKPHSKTAQKVFESFFSECIQLHNVEVFETEELALDWLQFESENVSLGRYEIYPS